MAAKDIPCDCVIDVGVRAGTVEGGGGSPASLLQKFLKMCGRNADDSGKSTREKTF